VASAGGGMADGERQNSVINKNLRDLPELPFVRWVAILPTASVLGNDFLSGLRIVSVNANLGLNFCFHFLSNAIKSRPAKNSPLWLES
jgi:hypothetical protein